jgi:hypothetical protein
MLIKLDYDKKVRWGKDRFLDCVGILRLSAEISDLRAFRTNRGIHIRFNITREMSEIEALCLQALMGSDFKRECFNFIRYRNNPGNFSRNNILFARKVKFDREGNPITVSQEIPAPDIEQDIMKGIKQIQYNEKLMEAWNAPE